MCKSKCGGLCTLTLQDEVIDTKESLLKIIHALDKLTACSATPGIEMIATKNAGINEMILMKTEARQLLEEVNNYGNIQNGKKSFSNSIFNPEHQVQDISMRGRLSELKKKIAVWQRAH